MPANKCSSDVIIPLSQEQSHPMPKPGVPGGTHRNNKGGFCAKELTLYKANADPPAHSAGPEEGKGSTEGFRETSLELRNGPESHRAIAEGAVLATGLLCHCQCQTLLKLLSHHPWGGHSGAPTCSHCTGAAPSHPNPACRPWDWLLPTPAQGSKFS